MAEPTTTEPAGACAEPLERWDGVGVEALRLAWGVPRLVVCGSVGSTNDLAFELASAGCPAGSCVLADRQTAGRGRHARPWDSPAGLGVWMSLVLRPPPGADAGIVPLLTGLAVCRALEPFCAPVGPRVKWPNDVLAAGRKLAGILCEASWEGERLAFMVVGIGINVRHRADDFPEALRGCATSVHIAAGAAPDRHAVAGAVVGETLRWLASPRLDGAALEALRDRDALLGRAVVVEVGGGVPIRGEAAGFGEDGSLRVRTSGGVVHRLRTGWVRIAEPGDDEARVGADPTAAAARLATPSPGAR